MLKRWFSKNVKFCIFLHKLTFMKITVLTFFIISLVIIGLQKLTLSQIEALEILFWPCFIVFSPRINICWVIMSRICIILSMFFLLTLYFTLFSSYYVRYFTGSIFYKKTGAGAFRYHFWDIVLRVFDGYLLKKQQKLNVTLEKSFKL